MGNRAVITFDKEPTAKSLGIYLHWNGGIESVVGFMDAADHYKIRGAEDNSYQVARIAQLIGNFFGGTLSVGVNTLDHLDCENGDNGLFIVERGGPGGLAIRHIPDGKLGVQGIEIMPSIVRQHAYFQPDSDGDTIVALIRRKNDAVFGGKE